MTFRHHARRALVVLTALGAGTVAVAPAGGAAAPPPLTDVIVQFRPGFDPGESARQLAEGGRVRFVYRHAVSGAALSIPAAAVAGVARNPRVAVVEPDAVARTTETRTGATWGLDRTDQRALPLDGTYATPLTGTGVTAYVVDTGIRSDHSEFVGRVAGGYSSISDGRGSEDCNGHGTHVAGTVAGRTWGMASGATLVPVRVLRCDGSGSYSGIIAGLDWIVAQHPAGAPAVANMSLGGPASSTLDSAISRLVADGVTTAVAAGNANADACSTSPARAPEALTVGATTRFDQRASFSNFGSCLDLFAPGLDITSAWLTGTSATTTISGTSMASPHVAGAAAVLLSGSPALSPASVASALTGAATTGIVADAGPGSANRLLFSSPPPAAEAPVGVAPSAPTGVVATAGKRSAAVSWTRGADGGSPLTGQQVHVYSGITKLRSIDVVAGATTLNVGGLTGGVSYRFTVSARNLIGTSPESVASNTVVPRR